MKPTGAKSVTRDKATERFARLARVRRALAELAYLIVGALACTFALKGFILPNAFFDGGTTGIALVVHALTALDIEYIVLPLTMPFIVLAWLLVHGRFAVKTLGSILGLTLCLIVIPVWPVTSDKLLVAIFGGVFMGLGNGFANRGGAALDGLDTLTLIGSRNLPFTTTEVSTAINALIFFFAALTQGTEHALYSMLIYFVGSRVSEFVAAGIDGGVRMTIVSGESDTIRRMLVIDESTGVTIYKGERGFMAHDDLASVPADIIVLIATRLQVRYLSDRIRSIDARAFIVTSVIKERSGGIVRRTRLTRRNERPRWNDLAG